ncbi:hypothetical protein HA50_02225 [Pantoea cypripedii]|uniref:Transposase n=1 Tax=Pantoea cypripedii TaxID=55209 RepID=A0A1X1EQE8_PANCY|nr:hypothetical protein HA50_02225 [Pantoea cypripedii]
MEFTGERIPRVPKREVKRMTIAQQLEQKGIEMGIKKGKLQVARTMLLNGMDRSEVMEMTGLTEDDLSQLDH